MGGGGDSDDSLGSMELIKNELILSIYVHINWIISIHHIAIYNSDTMILRGRPCFLEYLRCHHQIFTVVL